MSKLIKDEQELNKLLRSCDKVMVLFYASWCPFSRKFLPMFEKYSEKKEPTFCRVMLDDLEELAEKYQVQVYPTVIFFEKGKVSQRLDGASGIGLDEPRLSNFLTVCHI